MEKNERRKIFLIVFILVILSIIGINVYANLADKEITVKDQIEMIAIGGAIFGISINVIFSNKSSSKIDAFSDDFYEVKTDVNEVKTDVGLLKTQVVEIDNKVIKIDEDQQSIEKGLYFVEHTIRHINQIDKLCKDIEDYSNDIIKINTNKVIKNIIYQINESISNLIRSQYLRGFNEFKTEAFSTKLKNELCYIFKKYEKSIKDLTELRTSIYNILNQYIHEIDIIKDFENGLLRKKFIDYTNNFIKELSDEVLKVNIKQKIAS